MASRWCPVPPPRPSLTRVRLYRATYIYSASWIYTGEKATRRIRENYLASVLRQNIAFISDTVGAGAVTTRIETDTALIQAGISEKVSMW